METKYQTSEHTDPIEEKEEVQKSNDKHIDQDFEGYPHNPATENIINPKSEEDTIAAGLKDGRNLAQENKEEETDISEFNNQEEEIDSDGSANAFERTEGIPNKSEREKPEKDKGDKVY